MSVATLQEKIKLKSGGSLSRFPSAILHVLCGLDDILFPKIIYFSTLGVAAPTFSKRWAGQISVRGCVFDPLKILLAQWIDEIKAAQVCLELRFKAKLKSIHNCLLQRETVSLTLLPQKVCVGFHCFRECEHFIVMRGMAS